MPSICSLRIVAPVSFAICCAWLCKDLSCFFTGWAVRPESFFDRYIRPYNPGEEVQKRPPEETLLLDIIPCRLVQANELTVSNGVVRGWDFVRDQTEIFRIYETAQDTMPVCSDGIMSIYIWAWIQEMSNWVRVVCIYLVGCQDRDVGISHGSKREAILDWFRWCISGNWRLQAVDGGGTHVGLSFLDVCHSMLSYVHDSRLPIFGLTHRWVIGQYVNSGEQIGIRSRNNSPIEESPKLPRLTRATLELMLRGIWETIVPIQRRTLTPHQLNTCLNWHLLFLKPHVEI